MAKIVKKSNYTPTLLDLFQDSLSTVTELRTGIFAPIAQISERSTTYIDFVKNGRERRLEGPWGKIVIRGNILTQTHRDIMDAILSQASHIEKTINGNIAVFFSGYKIQNFLGKKSTTNNAWLKKKLNEIKTTNIEFVNNQGDEYDFNITDSGGYSVKRDSFVVVFTESYMNFFGNQVTVNYKNELKKLLAVEEPLVKAIARFFFTHSNSMSIELDKLLSTLGYPGGERAKKEAKAKLKKNLEVLSSFGISVDFKKQIVAYEKTGDITHSLPIKQTIT